MATMLESYMNFMAADWSEHWFRNGSKIAFVVTRFATQFRFSGGKVYEGVSAGDRGGHRTLTRSRLSRTDRTCRSGA